MIRLYNTLSGQMENFEPLESGKVKIYVCGPTVYDDAHIGHGRAYVAFDSVVRFFRRQKFEVTYVRNLTDIDDKIIRRANEDGVSFLELSQRYTDSFHEDMRALGLIDPDIEPKASETIQEIEEMIQVLCDAGAAYESDGDVYFSIDRAKDYGKLSKKTIEDLQAGARVDPGEKKKDPLDFALWKAAKPNEPFWETKWGKGRPGWHIECSAMSKKFLGESIDIHAGGRDLIFPHHENEIAQSESANQKPFAKYWMHNGFVNVNKEKMGKSLGNMVSLKGLLDRFHPEAIKLFLLSSHYRSPIDFSDGGVEETARGLDRVYRVLHSIPAGKEADSDASKLIEDVDKAMADDFNSAKAVGFLFDAVKEANRLQRKQETLAKAVAYRNAIEEIGDVLGILNEKPEEFFHKARGQSDVDALRVEKLIAERAMARREKNFDRADQIRDELSALGVTVEDSPEGTTWRLKS